MTSKAPGHTVNVVSVGFALLVACEGEASQPSSGGWPALTEVTAVRPPGVCNLSRSDLPDFEGRRGGVLMRLDNGAPDVSSYELDCESGALTIGATIPRGAGEYWYPVGAAHLTPRGTFVLRRVTERSTAPFPTFELDRAGNLIGPSTSYPELADESGRLWRPDGVTSAAGESIVVTSEVSDYLARNLTARVVPTAHGLVLEDAASHSWSFVQPDRLTLLAVPEGTLPSRVRDQDVDRVALEEHTSTATGCEIAVRVVDLPQASLVFRGTFRVKGPCTGPYAVKVMVTEVVHTARGTTASVFMEGQNRGLPELTDEVDTSFLVGFSPEGGDARGGRPGSLSFADDVAVYARVPSRHSPSSYVALDPATLLLLWPKRSRVSTDCYDGLLYDALRTEPRRTAYSELERLCQTACTARRAEMAPQTAEEQATLDARITGVCDRLAGFAPGYRDACPFCVP